MCVCVCVCVWDGLTISTEEMQVCQGDHTLCS